MDEDHLSPELGRLIDAAKAAARAAAAGTTAAGKPAGTGAPVTGGTEQHGAPWPTRAEGWALLAADGRIHAGPDAAAVLADVQAAGAPQLLAAAFAVAGESADTLLPSGDRRWALAGLDPELPVVVKYLGRWVVVTLAEILPA